MHTDKPYVLCTRYRIRTCRYIFGTYDYEFEKYVLSDGHMHTAEELAAFKPVYLTEDDLVLTIRHGLHKQEEMFNEGE